MNEWISVKDRLPIHQQIILCSSLKGMGVATFVDSIEMNKELSGTAYENEQVDVTLHPYYFVSQEVRLHTFKGVTHWMELPSLPIG